MKIKRYSGTGMKDLIVFCVLMLFTLSIISALFYFWPMPVNGSVFVAN